MTPVRRFRPSLVGILLTAAVLACADAPSSPSPDPNPGPPPPPPPVNVTVPWGATTADGQPLPARVESMPSDTSDGRAYSWHTFVDSARLVLHENRTYTHHLYVSGWEGAPFGPPERMLMRTTYRDVGTWALTDSTFALQSTLYDGHATPGTLRPPHELVLRHGLGPNMDERFVVVYDRRIGLSDH